MVCSAEVADTVIRHIGDHDLPLGCRRHVQRVVPHAGPDDDLELRHAGERDLPDLGVGDEQRIRLPAGGGDLFLGRHVEGAKGGPDRVQLGLLVAKSV